MDKKERQRLHRKGKLSIDKLLQIVEELEDRVAQLERENKKLKEKLALYESDASDAEEPNSAGASGNSNYSLGEEEKRKRPKEKKTSPGRRSTAEKFAEATEFQDLYPDGADPVQCQLRRERAVWRLLGLRATLVGYRIYVGPDGVEPRIPGVTPRCEYGIEILVVLAYLKFVIGVSLDKACQVMQFFCGLPLKKSQADALLRQLADHWEEEFELLCDLLAHAMMVQMDETGWKIKAKKCSLWFFASHLHRVFLFGCRKDADTLETILPPDVFCGVGVSDDAATYHYRFEKAQKCWAHLLRKAIRQCLLYPRRTRYRKFLDALLAIYHDAKEAASSDSLDDAARRRTVRKLEARLLKLIAPWFGDTQQMAPPEKALTNLAFELQRLCIQEELFAFVLERDIPADNNESERSLRGAAADRAAGRTNQTASGARRRTIIVSVLETLRSNLEEFHLASVVEEVTGWMQQGASLFRKQWNEMQAKSSSEEAGSDSAWAASPSSQSRSPPGRLESIYGF